MALQTRAGEFEMRTQAMTGVGWGESSGVAVRA